MVFPQAAALWSTPRPVQGRGRIIHVAFRPTGRQLSCLVHVGGPGQSTAGPTNGAVIGVLNEKVPFAFVRPWRCGPDGKHVILSITRATGPRRDPHPSTSILERPCARFPLPAPCPSLACKPDGRFLALCEDDAIKICDEASGREGCQAPRPYQTPSIT